MGEGRRCGRNLCPWDPKLVKVSIGLKLQIQARIRYPACLTQYLHSFSQDQGSINSSRDKSPGLSGQSDLGSNAYFAIY